MTILEPVLNVREFPPCAAHFRQDLPTCRDLISRTPSPLEPLLLSYLAQGVVCGVYPDRGLVHDVLNPARRVDATTADLEGRGVVIQPGVILTDGTWVWWGVLPYYIATYHLRLPEPFVRFAQERGWLIVPGLDIATLDTSALDAIPEAVSSPL